MQVSHKIANAIKVVFPARRVGMMIAGLEVPHTHIHLVPLDSMNDMNFAYAKNANPEELKNVAENLRKVLQEQGYEEAKS
jgi:histidine triad (HIT) family protein